MRHRWYSNQYLNFNALFCRIMLSFVVFLVSSRETNLDEPKKNGRDINTPNIVDILKQIYLIVDIFILYSEFQLHFNNDWRWRVNVALQVNTTISLLYQVLKTTVGAVNSFCYGTELFTFFRQSFFFFVSFM